MSQHIVILLHREGFTKADINKNILNLVVIFVYSM